MEVSWNLNGSHTDLLTNINSLTLSWRNITVKSRKSTEIIGHQNNWLSGIYNSCSRKHQQSSKILDNVNGIVKAGSLVAIMGSSGSGKTTLLTAISKRMTENVEGQIYLNSQLIDERKMRNISGFVAQRDITISTLSAMEHAYFMSQMKVTSTTEPRTLKLKIQTVLTDFGLACHINTLIANLSGGERKRLSIAVQVLHDPYILFCDEPTTGLDSYSATLLVEKLQKLAKLGKIVLCSIHQPTSDIFNLFTQLIILSSGKLAYLGSLEQALSYFSSIGLSCPSKFNPADFFIMKLSLVPGQEERSLRANEQLCLKFTDIFNELFLKDHPSSHLYQNIFESKGEKVQSQWVTKFYWLLWRNTIDMKRSKLGHCQQLCVFLVTSLMLAMFYKDIDGTTQGGIQDIRGLLYLISSEVYFTSAYRVLGTFPEEIAVFLREKEIYPTTAYYMAKIIIMLPRTLIEPTLYLGIICMVQWVNGVNAISFQSLLGPLLIYACSASAYGCVLSALFSSPDIASIISVPLDLISLLMAGMFYNIRSLPPYIEWIKYLSQLHYTNEVFSVFQWQNVESIDCPQDISLPCLVNGTHVLDTYGYSENNVLVDLTALASMYIILNLIGCFALYMRAKKGGIY